MSESCHVCVYQSTKLDSGLCVVTIKLPVSTPPPPPVAPPVAGAVSRGGVRVVSPWEVLLTLQCRYTGQPDLSNHQLICAGASLSV